MPNLKTLRTRINSVKSTRKITSAMKMVAAAKLRRAQDQAKIARPYTERMERMLQSLADSMVSLPGGPKLLTGTGNDQKHLLVVMTSDRGLCGGFNGSITRQTRRLIQKLHTNGKDVKILCVGRKARDLLKRDYGHLIIDTIENIAKPKVSFDTASQLGGQLLSLFDRGEFDYCTIIYNKFQSAMTQIVTVNQIIPYVNSESSANDNKVSPQAAGSLALVSFEPSEEHILEALLPRNISVQLYQAMVESYASEQGARMTAMDSATRNAGDMIDKLTLTYNRARQAYITKELIEIISGAEAV